VLVLPVVMNARSLVQIVAAFLRGFGLGHWIAEGEEGGEEEGEEES